MNDDVTRASGPQHSDLERELARFIPAELPETLKLRLTNEPEDERLTFADRVLVTFSSLGALAACMIVTIGVIQATVATPRALSPQEINAQQRVVAEYQQILAMR